MSDYKLGRKILPPPPPPEPEWKPCGKEREINTRTGMKRTVIKKNEAADLGFGLPHIFRPAIPLEPDLPAVEDEDEDNV
jgi:hypothetical protein